MSPVISRPSWRERTRLYGRTARRSYDRHGFRPLGAFGPIDDRMVFVVGCPRSGTTFTAGALGRVPGFVDLGEVKRLKGGLPELYRAVEAGGADAVVREVRTILRRSQRVAMASRRRGIEQTPESTFLVPQIAQAFPRAHFVHLVRDGRDVAASLVERGWLAGAGSAPVHARDGESIDDAGHRFGGYARFWVEAGREEEFEGAGEARRCAWAWRRYVTAARRSLADLAPSRVTTVRYEDLTAYPAAVATRLADGLGVPDRRADLQQALSQVHDRSVGRYAERLGTDGLRDVLAEAGPLLVELGYASQSPDAVTPTP